MKKVNTQKRLPAILSIGILGGIASAIITVIVIIGNNTVGGHLLYSLDFILTIPGDNLWPLFKKGSASSSLHDSISYGTYQVIVNLLIGTIVTVFITAMWRGLKGGGHEN